MVSVRQRSIFYGGAALVLLLSIATCVDAKGGGGSSGGGGGGNSFSGSRSSSGGGSTDCEGPACVILPIVITALVVAYAAWSLYKWRRPAVMYASAKNQLTKPGHPGALGCPPSCQWTGGYLEGGGANGSMYQFTFTPNGELHGFGRDADGQAQIEGRWSGEGNIIFWIERLGRLNTFCSSVYELSVEGNFVLKGSFTSSTGVTGKFMASSPPPNTPAPPPPGSVGAPALSYQPAGYSTPFGLARNLSRAVSRARGTSPAFVPGPPGNPNARPTLEKSRSMKELSDELPDGWEACRNYANNMVYYVDHNTQTTTYLRPPGGPRGKKLPYVGLPAGGDPSSV